IIFFAAAGAGTAAQSLLGLYEIATGRSVPEVAIAKTIQLFFPILYVIFSSFGLIELLFWLATVLLFVAGVRVHCAYHRAQMPGAPGLCDRFERLPSAVGHRLRRLTGRT